jgi:hypothetical protein
MKKIILKIGILTVLAMIILPAVQTLAADNNDYTVLAPLPGTLKTGVSLNGSYTDLQTYLPGLFNLLIGLAAVAAVLNIVIGGFQYMSTDAINSKSAGKERIKNAIFALVLIIGAWLILYTINPNLLNLNLNISAVTTSSATGAGGTLNGVLAGYTLTQAQVDTNTAMVDDLKNNYGISVNAGPCTNGETSGCTNLVGLPQVAYLGVTSLEGVCGCNITITGGTEGSSGPHWHVVFQ